MIEQRIYHSLSQEPIEWFRRHVGRINAMTYNRYTQPRLTAAIRNNARNNTHNDFVLSLLLTEMDICQTWRHIEKYAQEHKESLPEGFRVQSGYLRVGEEFGQHVYLQSGHGPDRIILCHSGAQIMEGEVKGAKVAELKRRAKASAMPELVQTIGNFTLIYGRASDIAKHLGMTYFEEYPRMTYGELLAS